MRSFDTRYLERIPISHRIARTLAALGEWKGHQDLYARQTPQALETLRLVAIIQSTESSNRIEQVTAPRRRIEELVAEKTTPANRSEEEIAGYRDVLNTIHSSYRDIPFSVGVVQQLHRDLYRHTVTPGGRFKMSTMRSPRHSGTEGSTCASAPRARSRLPEQWPPSTRGCDKRGRRVM